MANTNAPLPVSSVIADLKLDDDGVAKNVATLLPNPETPVLIGNPVQFVSVPLAGVPRTGVTNVGDVANTNAPLPVSSVIADIKLEEDGVAKNVATLLANPETPLLIGNPVQFASEPVTSPTKFATSVPVVIDKLPVEDPFAVPTRPI